MFLTRREPGVPLSDLILFPFLLLFFYIVPYPSISSMSFLLIYSAVVSGRHSICCFPHCSHMFLTRREPGVPLSLFRPYPLPFSPPFLLYCSLPFLFSSISFSLIYICCSFRGGILSVVFHCSHMFLTCREPGVPLSLFRPYPLPFSPPFLLYCS